MTQKILNVILTLGLVTVGFMTFSVYQAQHQSTQSFGAVTNNIGWYQHLVAWFDSTVYFGSTQQMSIDSSGNVTAPTLTLSKSTGTSTVAVGCMQATATSSATTIKLVFSPTGATSTFSGTAYWSYGTCP